MRNKGKRILSGTLACCLLATTLGGCAGEATKNSSGNSDKNTSVIEGKAENVAYNAEGSYTTTVTVENTKFADNISADDITVKYGYPDSAAYEKALSDAGKTEPEVNPEDYEDEESYQKAYEETMQKFYDESGINPEDYMTWYKPDVQELSLKDTSSLEISFKDADAAANATEEYIIEIPSDKAGGKTVEAYVETTFPDHTLTPDVKSVSAFDNEIKVTLVFAEGSFADNVTADQLSLESSFEDMKIDSISSAGKNLTVQLTGDLKKCESMDLYLPGCIEVDKSAMVNGTTPSRASVEIETQSFGFDYSNITITDGKLKAPFEITGFTLSENAEVSDFTIDGMKVTDFERTSENAGVLTIDAADAKDMNSASVLLDGKSMEIAAKAVSGADESVALCVDLSAASFYPVFDFADVKDGNFEITTVLYANDGTFTDSLNADSVTFADDFADAQVTSITKDSDTTATLVFSVDAKGADVEKMNLTGTISLKADTLQSRWGDTLSEDYSHTRTYEQTSMGKFPIAGNGSLTTNDLENIQSIVGGFGNTTFGTIAGSVSGLTSAASGIVTILELTGVIESQKVKLDKIYDAIVELQKQLDALSEAFDESQKQELANRIGLFYSDHLYVLQDACETALGHIYLARSEVLGTEMVEQVVTDENGEPVKDENGNDIVEEVEVAKEPKTDEEFRAVWKRAAEIAAPVDTFATIQTEFNLIKNRLQITGVNTSNPLTDYDKYMTQIYNFDTQTCEDRNLFGTFCAYKLTQAAALLSCYYQYGSTKADTKNVAKIKKDMAVMTGGMPEEGGRDAIKEEEATGILTKYILSTKPRTDGYVYSYVRNQEFHNELAWAKNARWGIASKQDDDGGCDDWNDDQLKEFLDRMINRNKKLKEELSLAGISDPLYGGTEVWFHCYKKNREYCGHRILDPYGIGTKVTDKPRILWKYVQNGSKIVRWWKK